MNKAFVVFLAAFMAFAFAGCGFGDVIGKFTSQRSSSEVESAASGSPSSESSAEVTQAPGADLIGAPDSSSTASSKKDAPHPQKDMSYLLMNTPGLSGNIVFHSDGTFSFGMGPHNSEGAGFSGTYSEETPQKYILSATEHFFAYESEQSSATFTAVIENERIVVTRDTSSDTATAFNEMVFYIPSDRVVKPDKIEEPESTADTTEVLNLRMGPGTDYDIILETNAYDSVTVKGRLNDSDEWVYVQYENIFGWVSTQWLSGETIASTIATSRASIINPRYKFSITVPSNWTEGPNSDNGDGFVIECGNDIKMSAYGEYAVLPQEFYISATGGETVSDFSFDSGVKGWQIEKAGEHVKFLYRTGASGGDSARYTTYYVDYTGNPQWYGENHAIILEAARSLKNTE